MSRSIHTTRETIRKLEQRKKQKGASPEELENDIARNKKNLERKRLIKKQVLEQRRRSFTPLAGTSFETIPIEVQDKSPFVHYPASVEDIRTVLRLLPSEATEGITSIQLCLGKELMKELEEFDKWTKDPFTGRISAPIIPNIFCGCVLGNFQSVSGKILLFAYVYNPSSLPIPSPICGLYLRLHALKTLVHEVVHHYDQHRRVSRGRWLADHTPRVEVYAENMEEIWTKEVVLPYLKKQYPKEVRQLRKWTAIHGGVLLPFEFFSGGRWTTEKNGVIHVHLPTAMAFEDWISVLHTYSTRSEQQLGFAKRLNESGMYDECLIVLQNILMEQPQNISVMECKADTLLCLKKYDEAMLLAHTILDINAGSISAFDTCTSVFKAKKEWNELLRMCEEREKLPGLTRKAKGRLFINKAIAHCALDHPSEMDVAIRAYSTCREYSDEKGAQRGLRFTRRMIYRSAGKTIPPELLSTKETSRSAK